MRIHFIAIGGAAMHNLALAVASKKGYVVTVKLCGNLTKQSTSRFLLTEFDSYYFCLKFFGGMEPFSKERFHKYNS